jgi:hypothetical protein
VQILDKEEWYTPLKNGDLALLVQKWDRPTWTLEQAFEVILRGDMPVKEICRRLACTVDIPVKSLKVLLLQPYNEIRLSDLYLNAPAGPRMWISPLNEERVLSKMQWHMRDWDLIMLQDESAPLKKLSKAELQTVQEAKANSSNYGYDYYSYSNTTYPSVNYSKNTGGTNTSDGAKKSRTEQGKRCPFCLLLVAALALYFCTCMTDGWVNGVGMRVISLVACSMFQAFTSRHTKTERKSDCCRRRKEEPRERTTGLPLQIPRLTPARQREATRLTIMPSLPILNNLLVHE